MIEIDMVTGLNSLFIVFMKGQKFWIELVDGAFSCHEWGQVTAFCWQSTVIASSITFSTDILSAPGTLTHDKDILALMYKRWSSHTIDDFLFSFEEWHSAPTSKGNLSHEDRVGMFVQNVGHQQDHNKLSLLWTPQILYCEWRFESTVEQFPNSLWNGLYKIHPQKLCVECRDVRWCNVICILKVMVSLVAR